MHVSVLQKKKAAATPIVPAFGVSVNEQTLKQKQARQQKPEKRPLTKEEREQKMYVAAGNASQG